MKIINAGGDLEHYTIQELNRRVGQNWMQNYAVRHFSLRICLMLICQQNMLNKKNKTKNRRKRGEIEI